MLAQGWERPRGLRGDVGGVQPPTGSSPVGDIPFLPTITIRPDPPPLQGQTQSSSQGKANRRVLGARLRSFSESWDPSPGGAKQETRPRVCPQVLNPRFNWECPLGTSVSRLSEA